MTMSRLIDADALPIVAKGKNHHRKYVFADITDAPTIDAIPVEWLKKVQTECVCDVQQIPMYVAIGWLRDMWQQEQEAHST